MEALREFVTSALGMPASVIPFAIGVLLVALAGYLLLMWAIRARGERRERLRCPAYHSMTRVVFGLASDGTPIEVRRCALFSRRRIVPCRYDCLRALGKPAR